MKSRHLQFLSVLGWISLHIQVVSLRAQSQPDYRLFSLGEFRLESGVVLSEAKIAYVTHGTLNAERRNAILVPSWYMGTHRGYDFLIGPGKALDSTKYFLVLTEMFANGRSSSPSNTPPPLDGPRFPQVSIRDNIAAAHRLLTGHLGVTHLKAVAGFSMGAQQAFQWAVSHPDLMEAVVAWCGTAKTYPHGALRLESGIKTIEADPAFNAGAYTDPPVRGLTAWEYHWAAWVFSQEWWRRELFRPRWSSIEQMMRERVRDGLSDDANNQIFQARAWQRHNVGDTPGFGGDHERALRSIRARVLYLPCQTDLYFPIGEIEYESRFIRNLKVVPIPSLWGHAAGGGVNPADSDFLNMQIRRFLR